MSSISLSDVWLDVLAFIKPEKFTELGCVNSTFAILTVASQKDHIVGPLCIENELEFFESTGEWLTVAGKNHMQICREPKEQWHCWQNIPLAQCSPPEFIEGFSELFVLGSIEEELLTFMKCIKHFLACCSLHLKNTRRFLAANSSEFIDRLFTEILTDCKKVRLDIFSNRKNLAVLRLLNRPELLRADEWEMFAEDVEFDFCTCFIPFLCYHSTNQQQLQNKVLRANAICSKSNLTKLLDALKQIFLAQTTDSSSPLNTFTLELSFLNWKQFSIEPEDLLNPNGTMKLSVRLFSTTPNKDSHSFPSTENIQQCFKVEIALCDQNDPFASSNIAADEDEANQNNRKATKIEIFGFRNEFDDTSTSEEGENE